MAYFTIHPLRVYTSMVFSTVRDTYNRHQSISEHFRHQREKSPPPGATTPITLTLSPDLSSHWATSCLSRFAYPECFRQMESRVTWHFAIGCSHLILSRSVCQHFCAPFYSRASLIYSCIRLLWVVSTTAN